MLKSFSIIFFLKKVIFYKIFVFVDLYVLKLDTEQASIILRLFLSLMKANIRLFLSLTLSLSLSLFLSLSLYIYIYIYDGFSRQSRRLIGQKFS